MKKLVVLILSLVFLLGIIVFTYIFPKKQAIPNVGSHSDVEGVFVEVESINIYPDKKTLTVSWNNKTEHTVTHGAMFAIERLENGKWFDCSLWGNTFILLAYTLNGNETIKKEHLLTDMYDISKPGIYRYRSTFSIDAEEKRECSLWAEFVIE